MNRHQPADRRAPTSALTSAEADSVGTSFTVPGDPYGKGRPKFARQGKGVRVYTPKATLDAEERTRDAWRRAGARHLGDGPLRIVLVVVHGRPPSHYLTDGVSLSAAGRRAGDIPTCKPDVDNVLKLVGDALNGCAYKDDAQLATGAFARRWAVPGEQPHVFVHLTQENA